LSHLFFLVEQELLDLFDLLQLLGLIFVLQQGLLYGLVVPRRDAASLQGREEAEGHSLRVILFVLLNLEFTDLVKLESVALQEDRRLRLLDGSEHLAVQHLYFRSRLLQWLGEARVVSSGVEVARHELVAAFGVAVTVEFLHQHLEVHQFLRTLLDQQGAQRVSSDRVLVLN